jgi:hypothetical protein
LRKSFVLKVTNVCAAITNVLIAPSDCAKARAMDNPNVTGIRSGMEYRGVEYSVVQGVERGTWRWTVSPGANETKSGLASSKRDAATKAESVIDRAFWTTNRRLIPPR